MRPAFGLHEASCWTPLEKSWTPASQNLDAVRDLPTARSNPSPNSGRLVDNQLKTATRQPETS